MKTKYTSMMSFKFRVDSDDTKVVYSYNGDDASVTGGRIRDPIKYMRTRVDDFLQTGGWVVVGEVTQVEFPRQGIKARMESGEVFIVGQSQRAGEWVVELSSDLSITRVKGSRLTELTDIDVNAFTIAKDLGVSYSVAVQMVKKGYIKQ